MKTFFTFLLSALFMGSTLAQPITFCGIDDECRIAVNDLSCEDLLRDYIFSGSCCSLETILLTGGCRVRVGNNGNCAWTPRCGVCDKENIQCNQQFKTGTSAVCPDTEFDALEIQARTQAPGSETDAPTCAPLPTPSGNQDRNIDSASSSVGIAVSAALALLSLLSMY